MYCAYKSGSMQLNVSDLNIGDSVAREQLLGHVQKTRGTFLDNGYERCDTTKGTSYCYSFWVLNENGKPKMLNQGEWCLTLHLHVQHVFRFPKDYKCLLNLFGFHLIFLLESLHQGNFFWGGFSLMSLSRLFRS